VTEIVFALSCGHRVVGVSDYATYPPEAKEKSRIGGWINPNRERLLVLKPGIIVSQGKHETLAAFAAEYDIPFLTLDLDTLADINTAIASLATALNVEHRGVELTNRIRNALASVRKRVQNADPKRVLLLFGRMPGDLTGLSTVGPGTFIDEMIGIAGGVNIYGDAKGVYPQVSKESLLIRKPQVILEVNPGGLPEKNIERLRADWEQLADIPAVRDNRVVYLSEDYLLIPGPRVGLAAARLAEAIHPEFFHE
jgi:iron complex transport system substrate-binding protein